VVGSIACDLESITTGRPLSPYTFVHGACGGSFESACGAGWRSNRGDRNDRGRIDRLSAEVQSLPQRRLPDRRDGRRQARRQGHDRVLRARVVAPRFARAVHLAEHHRAKLLDADRDVDGRTVDRRQPAVREDLHDARHLCVDRRDSVVAHHAAVVLDWEEQVRRRALADAHLVEEAASNRAAHGLPQSGQRLWPGIVPELRRGHVGVPKVDRDRDRSACLVDWRRRAEWLEQRRGEVRIESARSRSGRRTTVRAHLRRDERTRVLGCGQVRERAAESADSVCAFLAGEMADAVCGIGQAR